MTFFRQDYIGPGLATFLLVLMCYIAGRIHQFFKQTIEREQAYRDGYNQATKSLFNLATRTAKGTLVEKNEKPKPLRGFASVPHNDRHPLPARHRAEGRRQRNLADTKKFTDWPEAKQAA